MHAHGAGEYETALAVLGTVVQDLAVIAEMISTSAGARPNRWGVVAEVARQVADELPAAAKGLPAGPPAEIFPGVLDAVADGWAPPTPAEAPDDDEGYE